MIFLIYNSMKEKGIKVPLPYYWYVYGVEIEWYSLDKMLNKIGYEELINGTPARDIPFDQFDIIAKHTPK